MSISINQPMTIENILSKSVELYTSVFKKIFPFTIILGILFSIPNLYYSLSVNSEQFNANTNANLFTLSKSIIFGLVLALALSLLNGSMIYAIGKIVANETASFKNALQKSFSKLHILIGTQLLFFVFILILAAFSILIAKFSLMAFGIAFFVLITLIMIIRFCFYIPLIIFDNAGPISAMSKSYHITVGFWWRTLLLSFLASLPHLVFVVIDMPLNLLSKYIVDVMNIIESVVTLPFSLTVLYLQYLDLKNRNGLTPVNSPN